MATGQHREHRPEKAGFIKALVQATIANQRLLGTNTSSRQNAGTAPALDRRVN